MPKITREDLLVRAKEMIPTLRERAEETEALRRIPDQTIRDLVDGGFIRATLPARYGGAELDYRSIMEIIGMISRGCASTGWVLCNLMSCTFKLAFWPAQAQDEIWGESVDTLFTGNLIFPAGRAQRVDGGYVLRGRWPFGSGIEHAAWNFFAGMVADSEAPEFRIFLLPKSDFTILDTWRASGLRGTGSQDAEVEDVFVPEYRTLNAADTREGNSPGSQVNPAPVYRLPLFAMFFTWVGAVELGIAEAAVEDYIDAARIRAASYSGQKLSELTTVQVKIAEARALVSAARRFYLDNCDHAMAIARDGGLPSMEERARYRAEGALGAQFCCKAVDLLAAASGGGGIYDRNPLSRAFRDIHAGRAHITQTWEPNATTYGRVALGLESDNPLL